LGNNYKHHGRVKSLSLLITGKDSRKVFKLVTNEDFQYQVVKTSFVGH